MLAAEGLRHFVSESETWAEPCPAWALQAPHSPFSCRWRSICRLGDQAGTSGCQSHPDGRASAYRCLCSVPTPFQWVTNTGTGFLSKLSRKQGSTGIAFKSAWHENLNIHKTRQLLGGFTMQYFFCHRVYTCIHCKLLERRDASVCEKPSQNIPSAPTFSIHDYAVIMQQEIRKDTNFFGSLNWVLLSSGQETTVWIQRYPRWLQSGFTNLLKCF